MPSNASVDFFKARAKYDSAQTTQEKLLALMEMRSYAPKHKGAEKLRADISKKIAQLKHSIEKQKEQAKKSGATGISVKKEGCGQIVLVGMANSGKSSLLKELTNLDVEVAPYEFTTRKPEQAIMDYKGARVQLVELPAMIEGSAGGKAFGTQLFSIIRNADAVALLVEAGKEAEQFSLLKAEFEKAQVKLAERKPQIEIRKSSFQGITINGKQFLRVPQKQFTEFLKEMGYTNASVVLKEATTIEKISECLDDGIIYKPAIAIIVRKKPGIQANPRAISDFGGKIIAWNSLKDENCLNGIAVELFEMLNKILVYTKRPGSEPDYKEPLVMRRGSKAGDAARMLHKDFGKSMKFARVWGSTRFPGQRVSRDYELQSGDIIEVSA
ncbi:MAG: GTPase [archaeon]